MLIGLSHEINSFLNTLSHFCLTRCIHFIHPIFIFFGMFLIMADPVIQKQIQNFEIPAAFHVVNMIVFMRMFMILIMKVIMRMIMTMIVIVSVFMRMGMGVFVTVNLSVAMAVLMFVIMDMFVGMFTHLDYLFS